MGVLKISFFLLTLLLQASIIMGGEMKVLSYTQKVDHFGYHEDLVNVTFQQKVVVNDTLWGGLNAPIFVLFGDDSSQIYDPSVVGILSLAATKFKGMLVYIQHRFYGGSIPFNSIDLAMMEHRVRGCLTTDQALQDFADIIQSLKANISSAYSPVIVVGKGYGGALATWFRIKYPEIVIGSQASSTPLYYFGNTTQTDGYCSIVSEDFKDVNKICYEVIQKSWKTIDAIASLPNGLAKLGSTFNTCRPLRFLEELKDFLAQFYSFMAYKNDPLDKNLYLFCEAIEIGGFEGIVRAFLPKPQYGSNCLSIDIKGVKSPFEPYSNWTVAWEWQRCTELIFPVGCSGETMLPNKPFDMTKFKRSCWERFGVVPRSRTPLTFFSRKNLEESLIGFGGNLIFSNGLRDPYSSGGILKDLSKNIHAITTERGTYASDMMPISDDDPEWLTEQREESLNIWERWINHYTHKKSHSSLYFTGMVHDRTSSSAAPSPVLPDPSRTRTAAVLALPPRDSPLPRTSTSPVLRPLPPLLLHLLFMAAHGSVSCRGSLSF